MDKRRPDLSSALPHHHAMTGQLVWLVTGASKGLGLALCIQAAFRGDLVIATARDISRLDAALFSNPRIERARVYTLALDISWPVDELTTVAARAVEHWGRIDVVVSGHSLHTGIKLTSNRPFRSTTLRFGQVQVQVKKSGTQPFETVH